MAWADLDATEQQEVKEWLRDYRAAVADTVRGLRRQQLLKSAYDSHVGALFAQVTNGDLVEDDSGLAGADLAMTKAQLTPVFAWTQNLLAGVYSDAGGAVATVWPDQETVDAYGVQLAGPSNVG